MALSWHQGGPGALAGVDWVWRRLRPGSCLSLVLSSELASHLFPPVLLLGLGGAGLGRLGRPGVDGW